jgi:hypothetical protein
MYLCLPYTFVHVIRKRRYCLTLYQYIPVHTYTCTLWYPSILDICFSNLEIKRISESIPFLWWILRNMPFHVQTGKYRPVKPFLRVSKSNTKFATCGAGTSYPSGTHEFIHDARSLAFCVKLCRSLVGSFVLFCLDISLSVLLTASDYHFSIFTLFFWDTTLHSGS